MSRQKVPRAYEEKWDIWRSKNEEKAVYESKDKINKILMLTKFDI